VSLLSELKSGEVRQAGCVVKLLAQPINFRAAGRPGIFLTRSLLDGNLLPYHICHVGHNTTVLSKSIHSCRYDIKMTLAVAAPRRGEGKWRRICKSESLLGLLWKVK
jgi:hypothetical protein